MRRLSDETSVVHSREKIAHCPLEVWDGLSDNGLNSHHHTYIRQDIPLS